MSWATPPLIKETALVITAARIVASGACTSTFPNARSFSGELRAQPFLRIEAMAHFNDVIFSAEQWTDVFQIHHGANAKFGLRFGYASSNNKAAGADFEITFGNRLRFVAVERHSVGERFFALTNCRFQNAHAAGVAIEFGAR